MRNESGQTLLEIVAAIGVMVMILTAVTVAALSALSSSMTSKYQNLATSYAQQGIESMRNLRTTDYASFSGASGYYCLPKGCDINVTSCWISTGSLSGCGVNVDNTFSRIVNAPSGSPDCGSTGAKEIQVYVNWSDGKCSGGSFCRQVKVTSCFSNATAAPAP